MRLDEITESVEVEAEVVEDEDSDCTAQFLESVQLLSEATDMMKQVRKVLRKVQTREARTTAADLSNLIADVEVFIQGIQ